MSLPIYVFFIIILFLYLFCLGSPPQHDYVHATNKQMKKKASVIKSETPELNVP